MVSKAGAGYLASQQHVAWGGEGRCNIAPAAYTAVQRRRMKRWSMVEQARLERTAACGDPMMEHIHPEKGLQPVDEPMTEHVHPQRKTRVLSSHSGAQEKSKKEGTAERGLL